MARAVHRPDGGRRLLRFTAILLVSFIALSALWGPLVPHYNRLVALVAAPLFRVVESDNVTVLETRGDELWVSRRDPAGSLESFSYFDPYVYFGLVPLAALLIAIPWGNWARRARRTLAGLALLLLIHVIYVVGSVELTYAAVGLGGLRPGSGVLNWCQIALRILWQVSPVLIAVALAAGLWRELLRDWRCRVGTRRQEAEEEPASRSATC